MTQHEIVALRCPSCGSGITEPSREKAFGAEFRCDVCGISSVLIVDRALVPLSTLQKAGEKVCVVCGRVAQREARFCQEGHPLVRRCVNSTVCRAEFAVDHQVCDSCGWPQGVKPGTNAADSLAFDRAITDLASPSYDVIGAALHVIRTGASEASEPAKTAAVSAINDLMTDPSFRQKSLVGEGGNYTEATCWQALASLGGTARQMAPLLLRRIEQLFSEATGCDTELAVLAAISPDDAVPMLRQGIEKGWSLGWSQVHYKVSVLGGISAQDALAYCSRSLSEKGKNDSNRGAVQAAFDMGQGAIPTLEKFCGVFSGSRGKSCEAAINALRNGEKTVNLYSY